MIPLFYYQNENFGDSLSKYIVEQLSGDKVKFKKPLSFRGVVRNLFSFVHLLCKCKSRLAIRQLSYTFKPVLIAVGSLLEHSTKHCVCWGTGMAQPRLIPPGGRFIMTRGYLSRKVLQNAGYDVESALCGDPALLMPLIFKCDNKENKKAIGVIPHVSEVEEVTESIDKERNYNIIDFRTKEVDKTINQLLSCSFVYSSSLHGLILCHAYGIPCAWFQVHSFSGGDFKFNDHFTAVGIQPYKPMTMNEVNQGKRLTTEEEQVPRETLDKIQKELLFRAPFPVKMKL